MHPIRTYEEPVQRLFLRLLEDPEKLATLLFDDTDQRTNTGTGLLEEDCMALGWFVLLYMAPAPEAPLGITELVERCGPSLLTALDLAPLDDLPQDGDTD